MKIKYEVVLSPTFGLPKCITRCPFDKSCIPDLVGSYSCGKCFYFGSKDLENQIVECTRDIPEGIINIDTQAALILGFTSENFDLHSYLWRSGNIIVISMMISKKKGAFCNLMKKILGMGFDFQIPTPSARMQEIGKKQGWYFYKIVNKQFGKIDILTNIKEKI